MPVLTPEDTATLASFAAEPIGLDYAVSFSGRMAVEPVTGADVQVTVAESVGVRPQVTSLPAILEVLGHYPAVPEAGAASAALTALVDGPAIPLFAYSYEQTPASVAEVAGDISAMRHQVLLAKVWVPLALAAAALVSLAVGTVIFLRRRPRPIDQAPVQATYYEAEFEPQALVEESELVSSAGKDS
jgi:hypothetical protein